MKNKIHIIEVRGLIWAQLLSHLGSFHCSVQCLLAYHSWMTDWSPILIRLERNVDIHYRVKECKGKKTGWEDKQILVPSASCVDSGYCCFSILDQDMQNNVKEKHGPFLVRVRCSRASRATIHWNPGFWKEGIFFFSSNKTADKKTLRSTIDYKKRRKLNFDVSKSSWLHYQAGKRK